MLVKICGLCRSDHALAAVAAGADLLGLVFAPSKRQLSVAQAQVLVTAVRANTATQPRLVGLFVNDEPKAINRLAAQLGLDAVQLSGTEPVAYADLIELPIIKAIRMDDSAQEAAWIERARANTAALMLLVDAHVPGSYGGTGVVADWQRAARLAAQAPTILAGGLHPHNVAAAIAAVRPLGVDVSSGVEHDGVKDTRLIEAFLGSARAAQR